MKPKIAKSDWNEVHERACDVVNASLMNDEVLSQCSLINLFEVLDKLERKYGDHPSIIATRGDFTNDPIEAMGYFQKALELARFYQDEQEEAEILDSIENLVNGE